MVGAAHRLRRSHSTIVRRAQQLHLEWVGPPRRQILPIAKTPSPHAWTLADDQWLLDLAAAGWSQGLAANEMDRPTKTVVRHAKMLGVRWPPGNRSRKGAAVERRAGVDL